MASEIRVDKITSLSGVGTITPSPTGIDIAGITTVATLKATTGIVTTLTATTGIVTTFEATTGDITTLRTPTGIATHFTADKISLPDSGDGAIFIGVGSDFKLNHNGTDSFITEVGGGDLIIQGQDIILRDAGTLEKHIEMTQNGAVDIYHNGTKKFETSSSGVTVTGGLTATTGTFTGDVDIADKIVHTGDTNTAIRFPDADTITAETGGTERLRIASDGLITQKTGDLIIDQTNNGYGGLRIVDSSAGEYSVSYILGRNSGLSAHIFKYNGRTQNQSPWSNNGTGNEMGRWTASGIAFNGDTAAANSLDDYEEGTWTPSVTGGSINGTSIAYNGYYTKVGRLVHIAFKALSTSHDVEVTNYVQFGGLPFTVAENATGVIMTEDGEIVARQGQFVAGGTTILINACGSSSGTTAIRGTLVYHV